MWNAVSSLLILFACSGSPDTGDTAEQTGRFTNEELAILASLTPLPAIPADPTNAVADDEDAAHFGRWLYFDDRFSDNGAVSCATCHEPTLGFGDGLALSEGLSTTGRHAPSIFNTVYNRWMFWDGRCDSHWCQALGPIEDPGEMDFTRLQVAHLLANDADLSAAYAAVFTTLPDLSDAERFPPAGRPMEDITDPLHIAWDGMAAEDQTTINTIFANVGKAIAAYERLIVTGPAPADDYIDTLVSQGEDAASGLLSEEAQRGLEVFVGEGNCHFCHAGANYSNNEFHNIGLGPRDWLRPEDTGRFDGITALLESPFNGTGPYSDDPASAEITLNFLAQTPEQLGQFKVPSLRNVASHPPYMHGGHFESLTEVVTFYNELDEEPDWGHREDLMVPLELDEAGVADVVAFLEALSGPGPAEVLLSAPDSPIP
ncbi:MAG: cytochrome c peroxidase [Myxococcota bacterium]|jgi:cytochrome c peroxidase